jgi:hypothetical protein
MTDWFQWDGAVTLPDAVNFFLAAGAGLYTLWKDRAERAATIIVMAQHAKVYDPGTGETEDTLAVTCVNDSKRVVTITAVQACGYWTPLVYRCFWWLPLKWLPTSLYLQPDRERVMAPRTLQPDATTTVLFPLSDALARAVGKSSRLFCCDQFGNWHFAKASAFRVARASIAALPAKRAARQEGTR